MSERTHAVLDASGVVTNLVLIDEGSDWEPPEGATLLDASGVAPAIGDRWDGASFQAAPLPAEPVDLQAQMDALTELVLGGAL